MRRSAKNILITGPPRIGKTTLIRRLCNELGHLHPAGFYTAEIRQHGVRKGFELIDLNGTRFLLSHVNIKSRFRVGKYGVDIPGFEKYLDSCDLLCHSSQLLIIDEIGKMECFSKKFGEFVKSVLASDKIIIATIASRGGSLIGQIKQRQDIQLFELTSANRDSLSSEIIRTHFL